MIELKPIDQLFEQLLGQGKYPRNFQRETIAKILKQQNVLLRAPTGSGKTETAIAPFLFAKHEQINVEDFPNKLIYIVPLRTLATSLSDRTKNYVTAWEKLYPPKRPLVVTLQTGENPEDPRFEGDIVFCTIDQLLSSFLSIPYSVGRGSANVNAGVVFASYLVFDELHLLDPDRSFATTLKLLEQVQGISPYLLMTATLTHELAQQIQQEVTPRKGHSDDVLHLVNVEGDDLAKIEGSRKRLFSPSTEPLSAEVILQDIRKRDRKRVIVICNTVAKSQSLFQDLRAIAPGNVVITLLHSRFLPDDRKKKEENLQRIFAEGWRKQDEAVCQVLISTQVVEAGINITSEVMHTQLCPMNALLQRAGRCARFRGESGQVLVYRQMRVGDERQALAESEDDDEAIAQSESRQRRNFLPYSDKTCEQTWEVLLEHQTSGNVDSPVGFAIEEGWINQVHGEEDRLQSGKRFDDRKKLDALFSKAVFDGDRSVAPELIRSVDSVSLYSKYLPAMIDGDFPVVPIAQLQSFSLPVSTINKVYKDFQDNGTRGDWIFQKIELPGKRDSETYKLPYAVPVHSKTDLKGCLRLIVNPKYVSNDAEIGLRLHIKTSEECGFISPKIARDTEPKAYSYRMDTYVQHLVLMWKCWLEEFPPQLGSKHRKGESGKYASVCTELGKAGGRFLWRKILRNSASEKIDLEQAEKLFELLVLLAILTHDLGKLQVQWQEVMRGWQAAIYVAYKSLDPGFLTNLMKNRYCQ